MKTPLLATALVLALIHPVRAGTITGTVRAQGKAGADADTGGGEYDSRKFKFAERVNYAELHDFVVAIEGPAGAARPAPDQPMTVETRRVTQQGAVFTPHVLPIVVGTTVEWPNNDSIYHNVFSYSETQPFDLGLYKHPEVKRVKFDKPGRVEVFCSIHANMHCIILVMENPFFARTDADGRYAITNVPPGTYRLKAWHERLPSLTREVTVTATNETRADFTLGIVNLPQY